MRKRTWRWAVREALLTAAAVFGVICAVAALGAVVFDVRPLIFRTGSMAPEMPTGALALARTVPADELDVGDVVSVRRADGVRVTHRVVDLRPAGSTVELTLQGDGNTDPDAVPYPVREADRVFWSQPGLGRVVHQLESPPVMFACGVVVGAVFATALRRRRQPPGHDAPPGTNQSSGSVATRICGTTSVGVLAIALATSGILIRPVNTAATMNDGGAAATEMNTTTVHPVTNLRCTQTGTITTTATVRWNLPASEPVPTGYRVRVRSNVTGNIVREEILGAAARSYQIPAGLLAIGTYRVSVRSLYGSWVAPEPSNPPFVLVNVLSVVSSSRA
jgi:signal peptidase I